MSDEGTPTEHREPTAAELDAWNKWNTDHREADLERSSRNQADVVERWLTAIGSTAPLRILEVGCGTGWMCDRLSRFGHVTGIDLADEVLERARSRYPQVTFIAGDFFTAAFEPGSFDAVVTLETMAHFVDQAAFLARIHDLLSPKGLLMIGAQNRPMMERNMKYLPNRGWYRRWVDRDELNELVSVKFRVRELFSITPTFFSGPLHWLNSNKVEDALTRAHLGAGIRLVKRAEEKRYMGWTLMCLAEKN